MSLHVDSARYYFRPTVGSPYVHCIVDFYVPRPWIFIAIRFGSCLCYSGYIYGYEMYREVTTEVGLLVIRVVFSIGFPPRLRYFFVLKPWPCLGDAKKRLRSIPSK